MVTLNENTKIVIATLSDYAVLGNKRKESNWGVLFDEYAKGKFEAFAVRHDKIEKPISIVRISEFGEFTYDVKAPFFHYEEQGFMRNQMDLGLDYIRKKITSFDFIPVPIRVPYGNLINFIYRNFDSKSKRARVRTLIQPKMGVPENHILCVFDEDKNFKHPRKDTVFIVDKHSAIPPIEIKPGVPYICQAIGESGDKVFVTAKEPFFEGVQFGLYETVGGGFFPEERELYDFSFYPQKRVLSIPFLTEKIMFETVHVDTNVLMDSLQLYENFKFVDIFVGPDPLHPVKLVGVKEEEDFPLIETFIASLDNRIRGDEK